LPSEFPGILFPSRSIWARYFVRRLGRSNMRVTRANCNTSKSPNIVVRSYAVDAADAA